MPPKTEGEAPPTFEQTSIAGDGNDVTSSERTNQNDVSDENGHFNGAAELSNREQQGSEGHSHDKPAEEGTGHVGGGDRKEEFNRMQVDQLDGGEETNHRETDHLGNVKADLDPSHSSEDKRLEINHPDEEQRGYEQPSVLATPPPTAGTPPPEAVVSDDTLATLIPHSSREDRDGWVKIVGRDGQVNYVDGGSDHQQLPLVQGNLPPPAPSDDKAKEDDPGDTNANQEFDRTDLHFQEEGAMKLPSFESKVDQNLDSRVDEDSQEYSRNEHQFAQAEDDYDGDDGTPSLDATTSGHEDTHLPDQEKVGHSDEWNKVEYEFDDDEDHYWDDIKEPKHNDEPVHETFPPSKQPDQGQLQPPQHSQEQEEEGEREEEKDDSPPSDDRGDEGPFEAGAQPSTPPQPSEQDSPSSEAPYLGTPHSQVPPSEAPPSDTPPSEVRLSNTHFSEAQAPHPYEVPPADTPPSEAQPHSSKTPPLEASPSDTPPSGAPPSKASPGDTPPSGAPPSEALSGDTPPSGAGAPPSEASLGDTPPSRAGAPPSETSPGDTPPAEVSPSDIPPREEAPPSSVPPTHHVAGSQEQSGVPMDSNLHGVDLQSLGLHADSFRPSPRPSRVDEARAVPTGNVEEETTMDRLGTVIDGTTYLPDGDEGDDVVSATFDSPASTNTVVSTPIPDSGSSDRRDTGGDHRAHAQEPPPRLQSLDEIKAESEKSMKEWEDYHQTHMQDQDADDDFGDALAKAPLPDDYHNQQGSRDQTDTFDQQPDAESAVTQDSNTDGANLRDHDDNVATTTTDQAETTRTPELQAEDSSSLYAATKDTPPERPDETQYPYHSESEAGREGEESGPLPTPPDFGAADSAFEEPPPPPVERYSCRDDYLPLPGHDAGGWMAYHEETRARIRDLVLDSLPEAWSHWVCHNVSSTGCTVC